MGNSKKKADNAFLIQGMILASAGIITKIIGFIYRIPMLNYMGLEGQGYYDIAFQVYTIALTISSYSLPLAVSKLVSQRLAVGEKKNAHKVFKAAMMFALCSGLLLSFIVFFGANAIAKNVMAAELSSYALRVLAPGLLIVAVMGVLRGYFQGLGTMVPTAASQIIEQIINAIVSVVGAAMLMGYGTKVAKAQGNELLGAAYSAAGGTLGTVAGALVGLLFLVATYAIYSKKLQKGISRDLNPDPESYGSIFKVLFLTIAPVILSTTIYNISNVVDSAVFNKIMTFQGATEKICMTALGHLGQYYTLFNVPLAVASALGSSMIPLLVRAVKVRDQELVNHRIHIAVRYTMLIAIPSAVGFFVIGKPIMDMLWAYIDNSVQDLVWKIGAISLVFYSLSTVTNAVLQGLDRMMAPVKNAVIALVVHLISLVIMLFVFKWELYAIIVSKIVFSLLMCVLNSRDIYNTCGYKQEIRSTFVLPGIAAAVMGVVTLVVRMGLAKVLPGRIATLLSLVVAVIVFAVALVADGGITEEELVEMPKGTAILRVFKKVHLMR